MPELPEVETVRRGLAERLEGRKLTRVVQRRPDLRQPFPPDFAARLTGRRIESISRRAKYLLWHLDDHSVLIMHLGMSGRITLHAGAGHAGAAPGGSGQTPGTGRHDHAVFEVDDGTVAVFNDQRRFGLITLTRAESLAEHPLLRDLGPEPMGNSFGPEALSGALAGRKTSIKVALLDQKVVAGVGNIYACEALFRAKISPRRTAATIPGKRAQRLAQAIREVLGEAIEAGGSSLRDFTDTNGELGYFQHRFAVYGRQGEPCPSCGGPKGIQRIVQAARSTFFCPRCQR